jgi:hypothetical protein
MLSASVVRTALGIHDYSGGFKAHSELSIIFIAVFLTESDYPYCCMFLFTNSVNFVVMWQDEQ